MAIYRPDIYEHNNPNNAIADASFVKGGARSVSTLSDLYALATTKSDQLKENVTRVYVSTEDKFYLLKNLSSASNINGWKLENYVFTTGAQTVSGAKTFTNLITTNQFKMYDIDAFDVSGVNININDGQVNFKNRPYVNGSGVRLLGEGTDGTVNNAGTTAFNGNRNIKRSTFPYNLNVGGTNVVDFLENAFFPPVPAEISLNDYAIKDSNSSYAIQIIGNISQNNEARTLGALKASIASTNEEVLFIPSPSYGDFNYTSTKVVSSDTTINVSVFLSDGTTTSTISASKDIDFEYPFYYATGDSNSSLNNILYIDADPASGLNPGVIKKLETKSDKTIFFTPTGNFMYAIFPTSWGILTSIKDQNGLENIGGWTRFSSNPYYIWKSNNSSSVSNFSLTFKY
jgi:hypothetical protein